MEPTPIYTGGSGSEPGTQIVKPIGVPISPIPESKPATIRYIGKKTFDGAVGTTQIRPLLEEIHDLLLHASGGTVKLRIEIEGECLGGFSDTTLRALRENSNLLGVQVELDEA
ncbi:hypothetical protein D3C87_1351900 [compost metagenome]